MFTELRAKPREVIRMPLRMADGSPALLHNLSEHGAYVLIPASCPVSSSFVIEFELPGAGWKVRAEGEVVRIERGLTTNGIALRLSTPQLTLLD